MLNAAPQCDQHHAWATDKPPANKRKANENMPQLTGDEVHVLLDVITSQERPWEQYEGDPENDPKLTEKGWRALLESATGKLGGMLNAAPQEGEGKVTQMWSLMSDVTGETLFTGTEEEVKNRYFTIEIHRAAGKGFPEMNLYLEDPSGDQYAWNPNRTPAGWDEI